MRVLALLLPLLGGSLVADLGPAPPASARLEVHRAPVAVIPSGWLVQGSARAALQHALASCFFDRRSLFPGSCSEEDFADERPTRRVWIRSFALDRMEVSNGRWRRCMQEGGCVPSRLSDADPRVAAADQPVAGVTWQEASAYCRWAGGRLPTEAEWERAARADTRRAYPWGDVYNDRLANHGLAGDRPDGVDGYRFAAPVDAFPEGASPFGVLQMAGNVWEWVADRYQPDAYLGAVRIDPQGPRDGDERVVRGGSWRSPSYALRSAFRGHRPPEQAWPDVGLRCAYDRITP